MTLQPIYYQGKVRGHYHTGREAYISPRNEKHFARVHHGYGIQLEILENLRKRRCKWIVILYQRSTGGPRTAYTADFWTFWDEGIHDTLNPADGEQVFLPLGRFTEKSEDDQPQTTLRQVWTPANVPPDSNTPGTDG